MLEIAGGSAMRIRFVARAAAPMLILSLVLTGCGDDDDVPRKRRPLRRLRQV